MNQITQTKKYCEICDETIFNRYFFTYPKTPQTELDRLGQYDFTCICENCSETVKGGLCFEEIKN